MAMTQQRYKYTVISAISGLVLLLSTFLLDRVVQNKIDDELSDRLPLVNGSETYQKWSTPTVPVYLKFHFFNVSNPEDILKGKKAKLNEIGPFVYREIVSREIFGWDIDQRHLRFRTRKHYHFIPEKSIMSLDTNLTTVNLPLVALISVVLQKSNDLIFSPVIHSVIHGAIKRFNETLFVKRTAREMLFDGYQVPLMKTFIGIAEKFGIEIPNAPEDGKFGLMIGRNGSDDGEWYINTGKYDLAELSTIKTWNNKTDYSCWGSNGNCNKIKGTEGSMFPPPITSSSKPEVFCADLNRSIITTYKRKIVDHGVTRYRFSVPKSSFGAPLTEPRNECYCTKRNIAQKERFCSLDGILDLGSCNQGLPAVISCPHFFMADYLLSAPFESGSLDPRESKHESYFDLEPNTGAVLSAAKRLQLNVDLKYINLIEPFKMVKEIIFPSNWIEESFSLTETSTLGKLKTLQKVTFYVSLSTKILYGISLILILGSLTSISCHVLKNLTNFKEVLSPPSSGASSSLGSYSEVVLKEDENEEDDEHLKLKCDEEPNQIGSNFTNNYVKIQTIVDDSRDF